MSRRAGGGHDHARVKVDGGLHASDERVQASFTGGETWDVPARAWVWISERHMPAHNKGLDGLPALGAFRYCPRTPEPGAEREDG